MGPFQGSLAFQLEEQNCRFSRDKSIHKTWMISRRNSYHPWVGSRHVGGKVTGPRWLMESTAELELAPRSR